MPATRGVRILTRETDFQNLQRKQGVVRETEHKAKGAQCREQLMGLGKWKNTSWRCTVLKFCFFDKTVGTVNCLFTPSTHFIQQPVTVQQFGPDIQFCPGQNTLQSINDIFFQFCPKKKKNAKKGKEKKTNSALWASDCRVTGLLWCGSPSTNAFLQPRAGSPALPFTSLTCIWLTTPSLQPSRPPTALRIKMKLKPLSWSTRPFIIWSPPSPPQDADPLPFTLCFCHTNYV